MTNVDNSEIELLRSAYAAFNARDIDGALALMQADVQWPNLLDNETIYGRDAVRAYWLRQLETTEPHAEPTWFTREGDEIVVSVDLVLRDKAGEVIESKVVEHVYTLRNGLIQSMRVVTYD